MKVEEIEIGDIDYPIRLRRIKQPPKKLYVIGDTKVLNQKGIAIVGSRDCTEQGAKNAKLFAANIAMEGFTVISGMAKGIDASAHIGALNVKRKNNCSAWMWYRLYISSRK